MIALDTNVLVRYLVRDDDAQYRLASDFMQSLSRENPGFVSQPVIVEVFLALHRVMRFSREDSLGALWALVQSDEIEFDDGECVVEALCAAEDGADFADALIHANARQFQVSETVTFDRAASKQLGWRLL